MLAYAMRRTLAMIPMLIGISLISFLVMNLAPGAPMENIHAFGDARASTQVVDTFRQMYGLDRPWYEQYWQWLKRLAHFDFGMSLSLDRRPVSDKIWEALPLTIALNCISLALSLALAIPIGVFSALRRNSRLDRGLTLFVFVGFSTPKFWLALMLMMLFGIHLGWLPISWAGMPRWADVTWYDYAAAACRHGAIPIVCYSIGELALFSRFMRASMRDVLNSEYIVAARAKGLAEWPTVWRHAFPNALLPTITLLGLTLPSLIGGSVILEQVFAIPGMGRLFWESVTMRDYTLLMGVLTMGAVLTLFGNLLADIGYGLADPRIRQQTEAT